MNRLTKAMVAAVAWGSLAGAAAAQDGTGAVGRIVERTAAVAMAEGGAPGVGVAVLLPGRAPRLFTYGAAVHGDGHRRFTERTLFEVGSVTKIFTTNLLGQAIAGGAVDPDTPLAAYTPALGTLGPLTGAVTLAQLASFTGGWPTLPPLCDGPDLPSVTGCLPGGRPDVATYTAADLAAYFRTHAPADHQSTPPKSLTALPAPYVYSDVSTGLLGLLLAAPDAKPLGNRALARWFAQVERKILRPLGMTDTRLVAAGGDRIALGYPTALADATVEDGGIAGTVLVSGGLGYDARPLVRIRGGGGRAAEAVARVANGRVTAVRITAEGRDYVAPAQIGLAAPGATPAVAHAVIADGKVRSVIVRGGGANYASAPTVTIAGGRVRGRDATLVAHVANGAVVHVSVLDGGAGYVDPVAVEIDPPAGVVNTVPIWAPAGALKVSLHDMANLAAAPLGRARVAGRPVPLPLTDGFALATAPWACTGPDPDLAACPVGAQRSGFAWAVTPADPAAGVPAVVSKDGGLTGFSTAVFLMPAADLGVVVFVNARQPTVADPADAVEFAPRLAQNLLYALWFDCRQGLACAEERP